MYFHRSRFHLHTLHDLALGKQQIGHNSPGLNLLIGVFIFIIICKYPLFQLRMEEITNELLIIAHAQR